MTFTETIAVVLGLISVYLVVKQHVWCYPLGIISVFIYIFIFLDVKLYADMGLQVFFIVLQVYGWYEWLYGGSNKTALHVSRATKNIYFANIVFIVIATALIGYALHQLTDAALPYIDSFLAVLSMTGQWLMAKKYLENWSVWIAVNIGSIGMYSFKGLYLTAFLYAVYLVLAIVGYREWKKELSEQVTVNA